MTRADMRLSTPPLNTSGRRDRRSRRYLPAPFPFPSRGGNRWSAAFATALSVAGPARSRYASRGSDPGGHRTRPTKTSANNGWRGRE